jgi:nucleoside-diphosphate-sugar epimerase
VTPNHIVGREELVLVTGANGFIGSRVVANLVDRGFRNLRWFVRPSGNMSRLDELPELGKHVNVDIVKGNLLSREDSNRAMDGVSIVYHLAAGVEKTFPGCFMNSVITTRNLLDAAVTKRTMKRFVNVSSFAVYSNMRIPRRGLLDETCERETRFMERYEAYCFGKAKQDEIVEEYGRSRGIPYVIVRPGAVFGPGNKGLTGRVGIDTFGFFLHLGGSNRIPLTYVDNCADAIVLAGLIDGVEREVFNIVDDDLPTSRAFLRIYKRHVRSFRSLYIPYPLFHALCVLWEKYSRWSEGQLPPAFNRRRCAAYWKGNSYSNEKLKRMLGWAPKVSFDEAVRRFSEFAAKSPRRES